MSLRKSNLLTTIDFATMQIGAKILEQDERGSKVLLLENGHILKIFRLRGFFTSSRLYSNARSFCRNAERLQKLAIPTISIIRLYHFEKSSDTAVLYEPLAGETIRNLLASGALSDEICVELGAFIARLHDLGIHFKSLHFGNIVMTPLGELGLIDIADMRIFPWSLHFKTRLRGFRRIFRYNDDVKNLGEDGWWLVFEAYVNSLKFEPDKLKKIQEELVKFLLK